MNIEKKVASFVSKINWKSVSKSLQHKSLEHILDTLGAMCGGSLEPDALKVFAVFSGELGCGNSTVIGSNVGVPAPTAAFLNTFYGRINTFDDTYESGPIHPGSPILGATLAVSEHIGASGLDLLAGLITGYEISVRVADAMGPSHYASGFHATGTCTAIGAAAASARALGLNATGISNALGHAGSGAAGLRQYQETGSMSDSAINGARAAQLGVAAALLSQGGVKAPSSILTGRWGVLNVLSDSSNSPSLGAKLGTTWVWENVSLKPYPTCRFTHSPIIIAINLKKKYGFSYKDISGIHVSTFRQSVEVSNRPNVKSRFDALMSHQFGVAAALINDGVNIDTLNASIFRKSAVKNLMSKIDVSHDPDLDRNYPKFWTHRVKITLIDGRVLYAEQRNPPGHPDFPIEHGLLKNKFTEQANQVLGGERSEALLKGIFDIDKVTNMQSISRLLRPRRVVFIKTYTFYPFKFSIDVLS